MRPWPEADVTILRSLYTDPEISIEHIATTLGKSVSAVWAKARKLGLVRPRLWSEADMDLLRSIFSDQSRTIADIAKTMGRTPAAVTERAHRMGLVRDPGRWSAADDEALRALHSNTDLGIPDLATRMHRPEQMIALALARLGMDLRIPEPQDSRPRTLASSLALHRPNNNLQNEAAFAAFSATAAYWAGFFMSDGSIHQCGPVSFRIQLQVAQVDRDHLETFRSFVGCNVPVRGTTHDRCQLRFTSSKMAADMEQWGIVQDKTHIGYFPTSIPEKLLPHYLRGLVDGDGGIHPVADAKWWVIGLTNNTSVVTRVREVFKEHGIAAYSYIKQCNPKTGHITCSLHVGGRDNVKAALRWLQYDDDEHPALPRKRSRAIAALEM